MKRVKQCFPFLNSLTITMLLLLFALSIFNPVAFGQGSSAADFLFETGRKYYERGNYHEALHEWKKALLVEPEHTQTLTYIQIIEEELGLWEKEIPAVSEKGVASEYILGPGDVLEVTVWRHEELNKTVTIRPDGRISLTLVGEVRASGFRPSELSKIITSRLSRLIRNPKVTVIVAEVGSKSILILGEVNRPGIYGISGHLTALEAIALAGSYKKYACLKSTMIVRKAYLDTPEIISADLWSVISEARFDRDVALRPGDIVYVPKKFIGKIEDFMTYFRFNIKPAADSYFRYRNIDD